MSLPPKQTSGPVPPPPRPLAPKAAPAASEPEQEQLEPSSLDDLTHAEYRLLYDEAARNVLFAKGRQWRVLEYFTLLVVAMLAIGIVMPFAPDMARFVSGFLGLVGAALIAVLLMLQTWQGREHAKMAYLVSDLSNFARTARRLKPKTSSDVHRYIILGVMVLYVVVLCMVAVRLLSDIGR
jgi:hypothetical protein